MGGPRGRAPWEGPVGGPVGLPVEAVGAGVGGQFEESIASCP